ncbi:MAG: L-threonylcarbamoyladenylate synthase [Alphaproteobacteria bacterium]|jgi:L-threonylcarbamoyladenylate synthase|nr:L-threonylcarbamoyladenylate synthase [Alphaproteobacteria bacterium]
MEKIVLDNEIKKAVDVILNGGVVAFPTDTVWGFFCSPFEKGAVEKLIDLKGERPGKFFVLNSTKAVAEKYADFSELENKYVDKWPAPFTMIVKSQRWCERDFVSGVLNNDQKFSIRVPNYDILLEFLDKAGIPLISTSANVTGEDICVSSEDVKKKFSKNSNLAYVFTEDNEKAVGESSTLFEVLPDGNVKIYRQGAFVLDEK